MPAPAQPTRFGGIDYMDQDFFTYAVNFSAATISGFTGIAPGATSMGTLVIQQDSDFRWVKSAFFASTDASDGTSEAARVIPQATIQLQDTGSGRFLMNTPVQLTDLFGTGPLPFILPIDKVFQARATIFVQVANYGATDTITSLYLSFIGVKMFMA